MARKFSTDVVIPAGTDIDDLISGGPDDSPMPGAQSAPASSAAPKLVEIEIGGAKYLVPAESAEAIQAQNAAVTEQVTRLAGEVEALKSSAPAPASSALPADDDDDLESQLFLNPTATLDKFGDKLRNEMRQEYVTEQARQKWWDSFYATNKHLNGMNTVVEAVMNKHFKELEALPIDKQQAALAAKVDDELAPLVKLRAEGAPTPPGGRPVESGAAMHGGPGGPVAADDEPPPDRVVSIGETMSKQRTRRLEARKGRVSA